ncbi:hypothetical protein LCGC14_2525880 [marine sediment metagenome]|uniref:Copper chaperone PCu(A)C n=1 Tax=marine sediment metagenome TaxID=412755 RepID=A0A0F9D6K1_9ZZZZ
MIFKTAIALLTLATPALAGAVTVEPTCLRETLPGNASSAAYALIRNDGEVADRLIGLKADFAGKAELHVMRHEDGVMSMSPLDDLTIAPGEHAVLAPAGLHIMLMGITGDLRAGQTYPITLIFETAGEITAEFPAVTTAGLRDCGPDHAN